MTEGRNCSSTIKLPSCVLGKTTMSLHPRPIEPIPDITARIARQAFPKGNRYILLRDELGTIWPKGSVAASKCHASAGTFN